VRRRRRRYRRVIESTGRKAKATPIAEAEAFRPAKRHGGGSPLGRLLATPAALRRRAERAGLSLGLLPLLGIMLAIGALYAIALSSFVHLALPVAGVAGLALGYATLLLVLAVLGHRRAELFLKQLPDAIDIMIRSIRVGLPVIEGVAIVHAEIPDPLGGEFR